MSDAGATNSRLLAWNRRVQRVNTKRLYSRSQRKYPELDPDPSIELPACTQNPTSIPAAMMKPHTSNP